ncbi:MAG TPA: hypothetical protein GX708_01880 [Gallicola sp.]|nr:hypothetical protein [Gallicola sp.]
MDKTKEQEREKKLFKLYRDYFHLNEELRHAKLTLDLSVRDFSYIERELIRVRKEINELENEY